MRFLRYELIRLYRLARLEMREMTCLLSYPHSVIRMIMAASSSLLRWRSCRSN